MRGFIFYLYNFLQYYHFDIETQNAIEKFIFNIFEI